MAARRSRDRRRRLRVRPPRPTGNRDCSGCNTGRWRTFAPMDQVGWDVPDESITTNPTNPVISYARANNFALYSRIVFAGPLWNTHGRRFVFLSVNRQWTSHPDISPQVESNINNNFTRPLDGSLPKFFEKTSRTVREPFGTERVQSDQSLEPAIVHIFNGQPQPNETSKFRVSIPNRPAKREQFAGRFKTTMCSGSTIFPNEPHGWKPRATSSSRQPNDCVKN